MKMYADCTSWQTCAGHIELDAMGVRGAIIIIQHVGWVRADGAVPVGRRKNGATPAINIAGSNCERKFTDGCVQFGGKVLRHAYAHSLIPTTATTTRAINEAYRDCRGEGKSK